MAAVRRGGRAVKASSPPSKAGATLAMPGRHSPRQNHLLDALPTSDYERLAPHLELIPMPPGEGLYESGGTLSYVYFPTTSIVSLLYLMEDGASAEIALVGNEGILGISLFMGGDTTPSRAVVQSAGHGFRLEAELLKNEFGRFGPTMHLLLRYTQALITQMAQTAVCNRHHSVDHQLCRWLLLSIERLSSNHLIMTQELIANMLGVRREGVTEADGKLQKLGVIEYGRGKITVLDRPKLEQLCCEGYEVVKKEHNRPLPRSAGYLYWSPYAAEVLLLFSSHKTSGCAGRRPPRHGIPHPGFYRVNEPALAIRTALPCDMASKYPLKRRDSSVS